MPNIFQKIKNNFSNSSKSNSHNHSSHSNDAKKSNISVVSVKNASNNNENESFKNTSNSQPNVNNEDKKKNKNNQSYLFSLIIENDVNTNTVSDNEPKSSKTTKSNEQFHNIFDPDEAADEAETFNHITFIDDRSFIIDDDDLEMDLDDKEVAHIHKFNELLKENNCYTINELPETASYKSKLSSSRASSRNSLGSESIKTNSSEPKSSNGNGDNNTRPGVNKPTSDSYEESEESGSGSSEHALKNGSKNALLDALMRKFNVNTSDFDTSEENSNTNPNIIKKDDSSSSSSFSKQTSRYYGEDQSRRKSELERKINNKINSDKNYAAYTNKISSDNNDFKEATSSFDNDPKYIKMVRSTGTQMTASIRSNLIVNRKKMKSIVVNSLPQVFECKYIGKTKCKGLWGLKNIREPVDRLIRNAKRNRTLNDLPDVECLISEKGINIVQNTPKVTDNASMLISNNKILKSGLLPINNISYAVQDNIFGKVFSCIIVREKDNKVVSECYSFLCSKNEMARKMALSITLAFKEYAKLIQVKESKIQDKIKLLSSSSNHPEPDSYA